MCIDIVTPVISTIKKGEAAIPPAARRPPRVLVLFACSSLPRQFEFREVKRWQARHAQFWHRKLRHGQTWQPKPAHTRQVTYDAIADRLRLHHDPFRQGRGLGYQFPLGWQLQPADPTFLLVLRGFSIKGQL